MVWNKKGMGEEGSITANYLQFELRRSGDDAWSCWLFASVKPMLKVIHFCLEEFSTSPAAQDFSKRTDSFWTVIWIMFLNTITFTSYFSILWSVTPVRVNSCLVVCL